jgi:hypothetical protein
MNSVAEKCGIKNNLSFTKNSPLKAVTWFPYPALDPSENSEFTANLGVPCFFQSTEKWRGAIAKIDRLYTPYKCIRAIPVFKKIQPSRCIGYGIVMFLW